MFEIGSSLREARRRQGLELDDVVNATLIRARFLEALENERFDLLPDGFYRRSFLRRYADFLGLDGDIYVQELDLRFADASVEPLGEAPRRRVALGSIAASTARPLGVLAALALVGVGVWVLAGSTRTGAVPPTPTPPPIHRARPQRPIVVPARVSASIPAGVSVLTLTASRGRCWLEVRVGSRTGPTILTQTLQPGQHVSLGLRRPLWIRLGAPWNLEATIGGRSVDSGLPASSGNILAGPTGLQPAT